MNKSIEELAQLYSPYLYFRKEEVCYPITIENYLSVCNLYSEDSILIDRNPSSLSLYQLYNSIVDNSRNKSHYLAFKEENWKELIKGNNQDSYGYVRILPNVEDSFIFIYFYLFSHTIPYKLMNCCCPLTNFAHKADIKFIAVKVQADQKIEGVYFGAHRSFGGEYVRIDDLFFEGSHPIAFSCYGDHSFYFEPSCYPRIFGMVYDDCGKDILCKPSVIQVYGENEDNFDATTMGWIYFPGKMNEDGIDAPSNQWFWEGKIPFTESNNWYKRLFCYKFF